MAPSSSREHAFKPRSETHIDVYDEPSRTAWAERLGITDAELRRAIEMVGSRISMVAGHLGKSLR